MKVICINSKGRPAEVPNNQWIIEGTVYTVIKEVNCLGQGGIKGYELEEVKINSALYKYFDANRFTPVKPQEEIELEELEELIA